MRLIKKRKLKKIEATYSPAIRTIKDICQLTGRTRQQIEANERLNFGIVGANSETGDVGTKVLIDDDNLKAFIDKCALKDGKVKEIKKARQVAPEEKPGALDEFLKEMEKHPHAYVGIIVK